MKKINLGERISLLREQNNLSQAELARRVGLDTSAFNRIEKGTRKVSGDELGLIAQALHVPTDLILGLTKNIELISNRKTRWIPLVGTIAMGEPIIAEQNIEKYIPEYIDKYAEDILFALHCKGTSMEPTIRDGSTAIIRQQSDVENDEIAAVLIDGEATLKRVLHVGDKVVLKADNPAFKDIILDKNHPGKILGKLIKVEMDFD